MKKKSYESSRPQIVQRLRTTRWIPKATNTHSEYTIGISLTLQRWLHEGVSVLRHTYIDRLVFYSWLFRGKVARTFTKIISSPPTLQNNPLRCRRIPVRIVCSLAIPSHPITTNTTIFCVVVWNKLFPEACFFSRMRDLSWFWEERRKPVLSFFGTFHVYITSPRNPKSNDRAAHISHYKNNFVASGLIFPRVPASVRHWGIR